MEGMSIRKLNLAEHHKLMADFFFNVFTKEPWNDDWSDSRQLNAYIADLAGNPNSLCYGFFSDGGDMLALSIGGIKHWCSGTEYMINELCVRSDMQGRGTGTAFLEAIQKELLAMDIHTIYLLTESRVPAFEFYKNRGFVQEEYTVSFYKNF